MTELNIILNAKPYLLKFNYDCYPINFKCFSKDLFPFLENLSPSDYDSHIDSLIFDIKNYLLTLSKREQKNEIDKIKQVLALFAIPAVLEYGENYKQFANKLNFSWNSNFPKDHFIVGSYEAIMKGFDANLLGIPLRKSNKYKKISEQ